MRSNPVIDRRAFIQRLAAGVLAAPVAVRAQVQVRVRRVGTLSTGGDFSDYGAPLRQLGWIEGTNIVFERRAAHERIELLPGLADELVRLKVELIVADGTEAVLAAKNATTTIPIVMQAGDPVATGIVASLARPGGNITGYSTAAPEMTAKRAALLHELLPAVQRVALPHIPDNAIQGVIEREAESAYRSLGMQPIFIESSTFERYLAEAARQRAQAVYFPAFGVEPARLFIEAANRYRLPAVGAGREMVEAGGLMSYESRSDDMGRRLAATIDKILRGARPADLPIEQPTRFELIINVRAAKALGITVPQSLLDRADEVIR